MYGKLDYDEITDLLRCEFPTQDKYGRMRICGKWCKNLAQHITHFHKITARQYKEMMGLDLGKGLVSKSMKERWIQSLIEHGTMDNLKNLPNPNPLHKGRISIQSYKRSEQTKRRLRTLRKSTAKPTKTPQKPLSKAPVPDIILDESFSELEGII